VEITCRVYRPRKPRESPLHQRLVVYGQKGWSVPQQVPAEVMEAYERLVAAGYTRRLLLHSSK
jgi:hypothetical protein